MNRLKAITGTLALAIVGALAPAAYAQTAQLQVLTAGSSAQFGPFAVAAYQLAKSGAPTAFGHYTVKSGACPDDGTGNGTSNGASCFAYIQDTRHLVQSGVTIDVPPETGNLWVVWNQTGTGTSAVYKVWAYESVDSTVGLRSFLAVPKANLALAATLPPTAANFPLFWADGTSDVALPAVVKTALSGTKFTAANTDIRPEDALFATNYILSHATGDLGYGTVRNPVTTGPYVIGSPINSNFGTGVAHPIAFSISGTDPISGTSVVPYVTVPVGAAPIVFLVNSSLTTATNITSANAGTLFSGATPAGGSACQGSLIAGVPAATALHPILREPLSGTMNTTEFSTFFPSLQETGFPITGTSTACGTGTGSRERSIGTGDEVSAVQGHSAAIGYAFFSYESTGAASTYNYITLNGIDPIGTTTGNTAPLPLPAACAVVGGQYNCAKTPGTSFPNLRNGTYPAWSEYRVITDSTGQTNAQTLVTEAQTLVNFEIPDFVPFSPVCRVTASGVDEPGLDVYREHYTPSGVTLPTPPAPQAVGPNDGPQQAAVHCTVPSSHSLPYLTLGGQDSLHTNTEYGGDVGGTIKGPFTAAVPPTVPGTTQTSTH